MEPTPPTTPDAGFRAACVYTGPGGEPMGGLFVHRALGLPLRLLQVPSVPQAFISVHAPPDSDRGEAHTGEHLLLGKGWRGRALAASETMRLVESTAYTAATEVCYQLACAAGVDTFFLALEQTLEALLFPTYTDEEIRREVCHLAVVKEPGSGALRLEEKGTVYTEMVAASEKRWNVFHALARRLWGAGHPLAWQAGGTPEGIRTLAPEHVHRFHARSYVLGPGLGIVLALPSSVPEEAALARIDDLLTRLAARPEHRARTASPTALPPGRPALERELLRHEFPHQDPRDPGLLVLAWPARPLTDGTRGARTTAPAVTRHLLRRLLIETLADGDTSLLHRALIDRATRRLDPAAARVWGSLDVTPAGEGPMIGLTGLEPEGAAPDRVAAVAALAREELERLAALPAGDPALVAFNAKAETRLIDLERGLKRRLSMPPLFGQRSGGGGFWLDHLRLAERDLDPAAEAAPPARLSLTLAPAMTQVRAALSGGQNPWTEVTADLGLLAPPFPAVALASPSEAARRAEARVARLAAAEAALVRGGATPGAGAATVDRPAQDPLPNPPPQSRGRGQEEPAGAVSPREAALEAERARQAAATAALEAAEGETPRPSLVRDLPRTLDDTLDWSRAEIGGARAIRAHVESMSAVEVVVAFPLDGVRPEERVLLPLVGSLVGQAGLRDPRTGERLAYDDLRERLDREIGDVSAGLDLQPDTGRHELVASCTGADLDEARVALGWLARCLLEPDLSLENLPRLRDLVRQASRGLESVLGGSEEHWVRNPAWAIRHQGDPLVLAAGSIHGKRHQLTRLRWRLEDAPTGDDADRTRALVALLRARARSGGEAVEAVEAIARALAAVAPAGDAAAGSDHAAAAADLALAPLLATDPATTTWRARWGRPFAEELVALRPQLPPASAAADLERLADRLATDLLTPPDVTLDALGQLLARLLRPDRARLVLTGRRASLDALEPDVAALLGRMPRPPATTTRTTPATPTTPTSVATRPGPHGPVTSRALARAPAGASVPVAWALVHDAASTGVLVLSCDLGAPGLPPSTGSGEPGTAPPVKLGPRVLRSRDDLLDVLAGSIDAGAGPHAFFMNTWAAGLAYSNGLRTAPLLGRASYYAERCPDLAQTQRFVVDLARDESRHQDPYLLEYALAQVVTATRVADRFESRARALASDLEDGLGPEVVAAQRAALLALRDDPKAWADLSARRLDVLRRVLVGLGPPPGGRLPPFVPGSSAPARGAVLLAIGPTSVLAGWEVHVRGCEGDALPVHRLWSADLWSWDDP